MTAAATTSGTYEFDLSNADIVVEAFQRIMVRPQALSREHLVEAHRSANLTLASWSNKGVNLWAVDLQSIVLSPSVATYILTEETVAILELYIRTTDSAGTPTDRIISPIGRTDYAATPNKTNENVPSVFWFNREAVPQITFWPVPDDADTYTARFYRMRRAQDANLQMGEVADVPGRFLDAFCWELAFRLSWKYKPDLIGMLKQEAKDSWALAAAEDRESVPVNVMPDLSGYWRA